MSVQCIIFVVRDSAQCYSVVCGEGKILFTFTIFISRDYLLQKRAFSRLGTGYILLNQYVTFFFNLEES